MKNYWQFFKTFVTVSYGHNICRIQRSCNGSNPVFINEGTDEDDVEDALESLSKWAKKNHPGILSVLTPLFRMQSDAYGDLIIQSWMPFDSVGKFDEAIENGDFKRRSS